MTDKESMKLALEALETLMIERGSIYEKAIAALKERLAQPAQRTWVGLTDDEIALINADYPHPQGFARAIEAKLKEKNT